jgi:hypothetical protein
VPADLPFDFVHTREPVEADCHVVYGIRDSLVVPNRWDRVLFVASEPPEIREYNLSVLSRYAMVLGPQFPGVTSLKNYRPLAAVAPWWVGVNSSETEHYATHSGSVSFSRQEIRNMPAPHLNGISVIVSHKSRTPLQAQRLRLVDYLETKLPELEVFGVGRDPLPDKAEALSQYRYHLAVENSVHAGYWTEKLADPVLLQNFVFYGGHPSYRDNLAGEGIQLIDAGDCEATYRSISEALARGAYDASTPGIVANRDHLLDHMSFHRQLAHFLEQWQPGRSTKTRITIPAHHPQPAWKKILDPLYRKLR